MKYYRIINAASLCAALALSSCATLDKVASKVQSISEGLSGGSYQLPVSYDEAYSYRTGKIHPKMKDMAKDIDALREKSPAQYVQKVCEIINTQSKNDFEKVKMAQDHVAYLVHHDAKSFWENSVPEQNYERVLKTKLAVCEGYSNTLKKFLDVLKIKSVIVHGYARGVGVNIGNEGDVKQSNHAWVIAEINGEWYSVDCTWNSGYMDGKKSVQKYNTEWLFTKPEHFIYSHLPETKRDQLLETPLTAEQFKELPFMCPSYFEAAKDCGLEEHLKDAKSQLSFSYKCDKDSKLNFVVRDLKGMEIKNTVWQQNNEEKTQVTIQFPVAGDYDVQIFIWKDGKKESTYGGEFLVHATDSSKVRYAELYSIEDAVLLSPIESPLKAGGALQFAVHTTRYKYVAVIVGKSFIQLSNNGKGDFTGKVAVPKGVKSLTVGCASSKTGSYASLAAFKVVP